MGYTMGSPESLDIFLVFTSSYSLTTSDNPVGWDCKLTLALSQKRTEALLRLLSLLSVTLIPDICTPLTMVSPSTPDRRHRQRGTRPARGPVPKRPVLTVRLSSVSTDSPRKLFILVNPSWDSLGSLPRRSVDHALPCVWCGMHNMTQG